jgi:hypothetical protein
MDDVLEPAYYRLKVSEATITACIIIHGLVLFFWATCGLIKEFNYYDAVPPAGFHAITHLGFWLGIELIVLLIGALSYTFSITASEKGFFYELNRVGELLSFWLFLLLGAIAANIVHLIAAAMELADCRSSLCVDRHGFMIAIVAIIKCLIALELIELYFISKYKKRLKYSKRMLVLNNKIK